MASLLVYPKWISGSGRTCHEGEQSSHSNKYEARNSWSPAWSTSRSQPQQHNVQDALRIDQSCRMISLKLFRPVVGDKNKETRSPNPQNVRSGQHVWWKSYKWIRWFSKTTFTGQQWDNRSSDGSSEDWKPAYIVQRHHTRMALDHQWSEELKAKTQQTWHQAAFQQH